MPGGILFNTPRLRADDFDNPLMQRKLGYPAQPLDQSLLRLNPMKPTGPLQKGRAKGEDDNAVDWDTFASSVGSSLGGLLGNQGNPSQISPVVAGSGAKGLGRPMQLSPTDFKSLLTRYLMGGV